MGDSELTSLTTLDRYQVAPWMVRIEPEKGTGLVKLSATDAFQVRSLAHERFARQLGKLAQEQMQVIASALAVVLAIK